MRVFCAPRFVTSKISDTMRSWSLLLENHCETRVSTCYSSFVIVGGAEEGKNDGLVSASLSRIWEYSEIVCSSIPHQLQRTR